MPQTNYTPILIYASGTTGNTPAAGNLTNSSGGSELAINYFDGRLFYKDASNVVRVLASRGTGTIGGSNTQVQYNSGGVLAGSANLTFDGTNLGLGDGSQIRSPDNFAIFDTSSSLARISWSTNNTYASRTGGAHIFNVAAAEQMRLTSTGLGIGTSAPTQKLQVAGAVRVSDAATETNALQLSSTATTSTIETRYNYPLLFGTNATERMRLDSAGNLGLGGTPSAWSGQTAFQIGDTGSVPLAYIASDSASNTVTNIGHGAYWNGSNWLYTSTSVGATRYQMTGANAGSTHAWFVSAGGTAGNTISFTQAMTLNASSQLLVGTTTNTNSSTVTAGGTISETVSGTQYLVASQFDVGTAANEIPINGYLGALAYEDTETPALSVGTGITTGTGTICKVNGGLAGGVYRVTLVIDLTGLNSGGTANDIIGVNGTTLPCFIAQLPTMTVLGGRMTCLETPAGGDTDIDLYSAVEGTGVEDQAITALTETLLINAGAQTTGTVTYFSADPTVNGYLYLAGQGTANATYTAGRFLIEVFGV